MKNLKTFLMDNKYLWVVLPILIFGWYTTITELIKGDFVSVGDFAIIIGILSGATGWIGYNIYSGLKDTHNPF